MTIDLIPPYVGLDDFKEELGVLDLDSDEELLLILSEGAEIIDNYCNRSFHLKIEERVYDAPFSEWLMAADLQSVTSLSWYGTALGAGEYLVLRNREGSDYTGLLRIHGTPPQTFRWDQDPTSDATMGLSWGKIAITGVWGFRASYDANLDLWTELIPTKVARANFLLSARLWNMRTTQYTGEGGGVQIGRKPTAPALMGEEVKDLLNPYIREVVPLLVGSPYAD